MPHEKSLPQVGEKVGDFEEERPNSKEFGQK
jgi:hypothetical protein